MAIWWSEDILRCISKFKWRRIHSKFGSKCRFVFLLLNSLKLVFVHILTSLMRRKVLQIENQMVLMIKLNSWRNIYIFLPSWKILNVWIKFENFRWSLTFNCIFIICYCATLLKLIIFSLFTHVLILRLYFMTLKMSKARGMIRYNRTLWFNDFFILTFLKLKSKILVLLEAITG